MKDLSKYCKYGTVWLLTLCATAYSVSIYSETIAYGNMEIDSYDIWNDGTYGGVEIDGQFVGNEALPFHYIQLVTVDTHPPNDISGTPMEAPYIDPPAGGYWNDPWDYLLYYDEGEFPTFYDQPGNPLADGPGVQVLFETWLVIDWWGDLPHIIEPLLGWTWGYNFGSVSSATFDWKYASTTYPYGPTDDWSTATLGWGDVEIVPEPATVLLLGLGGLALLRRRRK